MLSAVHREFIRRVMRVRTRRTRTRSINYFAILREFAPQRIGVPDFAASWRSRATTIFSESSKDLLKEESLMKREATPDSATTQSSFLMDSTKLLANCPPKRRT